MKKLHFVFMLSLAILTQGLSAQDYFGKSEHWLAIAEKVKPELKETIIRPVSVVEIVENKAAFQGWEAVKVADIDSVYNNSFNQIKSIIVDFGDHYTGYFSYNLETVWGTSDAPTRLKFTFGEVPAELATPLDPYPGGLSRAWMQDEVMTVMHIPSENKLERRISFRYLKIDLMGASPYFSFKFSDLKFKAVTSAVNAPAELDASVPEMIRKIDKISQKTLAECMQTVFEDGPKRDRRLWSGDMYLQAQANNYSFNNQDLTKRCLYLFAGVSDHEGVVLGTLFETPEVHAQAGQRLMDYSLLFNVSVLDYLKVSKDKATAVDLWPVVKRQLMIYDNYVDENGLVMYEKASADWWLFFDWKDGLDKEAAIQGLMIFALKSTYELAEMIGMESEVAELPALAKKMSKAAMKYLYNKKSGLFESGENKQISYASQIWMTLAGVPSIKQSQKALKTVVDTPGALFPGGPYMYHYYVQALIDAELYETAKTSMVSYWGGMVEKGADTFWEVYDPNNDFLSPYNFFPVNSYCHAWSCTPVYFIRKYPEIFQK